MDRVRRVRKPDWEPRVLPPAPHLTPELEGRRQLLRDCINACLPRKSDEQFARDMHRDPRTIRRWLSGECRIPKPVADWLAGKRPHQKRKARESAREPTQPIDDERSWEMRTTQHPVRIPRPRAPLDVQYDAAAQQKLGATSSPGDVTPGAVFGTRGPEPWNDRWLCRCSDAKRKVTWRKAGERVCPGCGLAQPPAE